MSGGSLQSGGSDPNLFTISRVSQAARAVAVQVRQALSPQKLAPVRVLVVNDHPDAADAMAAVLNLLGCPVRACYSGATALTTAAKFEPEVCVLDSMLPGMEGAELAARLKDRAAGRSLTLVATTGFDDWLLQSPAAMSAFRFLLIRPVDAETLIETVVRLCQIVALPDGSSTTPIDS